MIDDLAQEIYTLEHPTRVALSKHFPILRIPILYIHRVVRRLRNICTLRVAREIRSERLPHVLMRHQSPLLRKLGESDVRLQQQKIVNLTQARVALDGLLIRPGETFSFWEALGNPTYARGYVDGMLLSAGTVVEGVGGGLCQLSNLLYWMFLHSPLTITERRHHSMDVFPDSGRTLPFGSGATVMYNFIDLQARNDTSFPIQIRISLTESQLVGQLRTTTPLGVKYHVYEKEHFFIHAHGVHEYYRHNEIWRDSIENGIVTNTRKITHNLAPVLYTVTPQYLTDRGYVPVQL